MEKSGSRSHGSVDRRSGDDDRDHHVPPVLHVEYRRDLVRQEPDVAMDGFSTSRTIASNERQDIAMDPSPLCVPPDSSAFSGSSAHAQFLNRQSTAHFPNDTAQELHIPHFPATQRFSSINPLQMSSYQQHLSAGQLDSDVGPGPTKQARYETRRSARDLNFTQFSNSRALFDQPSPYPRNSEEVHMNDFHFLSHNHPHTIGGGGLHTTTTIADPLSRTEHVSTTSQLQESSSEDDEWDGFADMFESFHGVPEREWIAHPAGVGLVQSRDNEQSFQHFSTESPPPHSDSSHSGSSGLPTKFQHFSLNDFTDTGMSSYREISTSELHPTDYCLIQKISPDWEDVNSERISERTEIEDTKPKATSTSSTKTKRKEKHSESTKRRRKSHAKGVEHREGQKLQGPLPTESRLQNESQSQHVSTTSTEIVLTDMDVLGGRGSGANKHPGNEKYWEKICEYRPAYQACHQRDYKSKNQIANKVFEFVGQGGGRFLERDTKTRVLYELAHERVIEKIKQALREKYVPFSLR